MTVCPLYTSEIAPTKISGSIANFNQFGAVTGVFVGLSLGFLVPLEYDSDAYTSKNWRIVFLFPGIVSVIQLVLMLLVFRFDTPKFYKQKGDAKNYEASVRRIYTMTDEEFQAYSKSEEHPNIVKEEPHLQIQNENDQDASSKKIIQGDHVDENGVETNHRAVEVALKPKKSKMPPHYKKALCYGIIYSIFHQTTGVNAITFFSNELFTNGEDGNSAERKARFGSMLVGISCIAGIIVSLMLLKYFARLLISNVFHIVKLISIVGMGIFSIADIQLGVIASILLFCFAFNVGIGGIMWVYTAETLDEKGCAIVGLVNMIWTFIFGAFSNFMIIAFTAPGFYFGLAVIQVFAISFIWIFFKETKGLTKEECETLYMRKEVASEKH